MGQSTMQSHHGKADLQLWDSPPEVTRGKQRAKQWNNQAVADPKGKEAKGDSPKVVHSHSSGMRTYLALCVECENASVLPLVV